LRHFFVSTVATVRPRGQPAYWRPALPLPGRTRDGDGVCRAL